MSENKKERNTQIPLEAIEGAAGQKDRVDMNGGMVQACCEKTIQIPTKKNTKTEMTEAKTRDDIISLELGIDSMEIPVQSGGIKTTKKERKEEMGR